MQEKWVDIRKIQENCVVKSIILRAVKHAATKSPHLRNH